jgi:CHAT domain-containing protein/Tfp pilus assembly protein PilF
MAGSILCLAVLQLPASAQEAWNLSEPGAGSGSVLVEKVDSGSSGAAAGLRPGDILTRWSSPHGSKDIGSPFELRLLELEMPTHGPVRIEGLRAGQMKHWVLANVSWGLSTRPEIPEHALAMCREVWALAERGSLPEAVQRWRSLRPAFQKSLPVWFGSWVLGRAVTKAMQSSPAPSWRGIDQALEEALHESAEAGPEVRIALLDRWADLLQRRDDLVNAEKYYKEELSEERRLGTKSISIAVTLSDLGILAIKKGNFVEAEAGFREALTIQRDLAPRDRLMATILGNLAVLADDQGDLASAEAYYRQAITIAEHRPDPEGRLALLLADLGDLVQRRGDPQMAFRYDRRALTLAERANPGSTQVATILSFMGELELDYGQIEIATKYQKRALAIRNREEPRSLSVALSLESLGYIAETSGDLAKADDLYHQALAIAERLASPPLELAGFLNSLGEVAIQQQEWDKAEELYRRSIEVSEKIAPTWDQFDAQAGLARAARHKQQSESAARAYQRALDILENQTVRLGGSDEVRAGFRARHNQFYREYVSFLVERKQVDAALEVLENARARTLVELLKSANADVRQGVDPTLLTRQSNLQKLLNGKTQYRLRLLTMEHSDEELSSLNTEVEGLSQRYHQLEAEIRATSPAYAALTQPPRLSVHEIQRLLDPGTLLLEYSLSDEHSYVWAVTNDSLEVHQLSSREEIERKARELYSALTAQSQEAQPDAGTSAARTKADAEYARAAQALSRLILAPLSTLLPGKRLVIVSDGALQYIPFSALPSPNRSSVPMVVEHEIVNLPSVSVLAEIRRASEDRLEPSREVAILADPVFDASDDRVDKVQQAQASNERKVAPPSSAARMSRSASDVGRLRGGKLNFDRLPYSRQESQAIAAIAGRHSAMQALDFNASRKTAVSPELAHYRIVHFATHGLMDSEHPEFSGLVLSLVNNQGKPQDGFLSLEDIYNLKLPVDLVVLSGCETGLGKEISGEGLIGLTRGFMYAGARRVVASLWTVDDLATSELMARFYRAMERDKMPPAAALRKAQIEMWTQKSWHSPYNWAGFQIQGEWK